MAGFLQNLGYIGNALTANQQQQQEARMRALQIQQAQSALDAQKRSLAALAAAYSGIGGPQAPAAPGGAPPQQMPLPGAMRMPAVGGMPGGAPMQMPAAPRPSPAAGAPGAPAGSPAGASPQGGGPAVSGVARPSGDPMMDAMNTVQSVAADIKRRNPGIDPLTLAEATQQMLGQMKGLEPEMRALTQAQTNLAIAQIKATTSTGNNERSNDTRENVAEIGAGSRENVAKIGAKGRTEAASIGAGARVESAKIGAGARVTAAQLAAQASQARTEAMRDVGEDRIDQERYNSDMAYHRAVDAAMTTATGKAPAAPAAQPRPRRGGQDPSAAPAQRQQYRSLQDLQTAYKAGKVTAEQAKQIARRNGWAE